MLVVVTDDGLSATPVTPSPRFSPATPANVRRAPSPGFAIATSAAALSTGIGDAAQKPDLEGGLCVVPALATEHHGMRPRRRERRQQRRRAETGGARSAERRSARQRNRDIETVVRGNRGQSRDQQCFLLARHARDQRPRGLSRAPHRWTSVVPSAGNESVGLELCVERHLRDPGAQQQRIRADHRQRRQMNRKVRPRQRAARELRVVRLVDRVGNRRSRGIDREIADVETQPRAGGAVEQNQAVLAGRKQADALRRTVGGESRRRDDVGGGDARPAELMKSLVLTRRTGAES